MLYQQSLFQKKWEILCNASSTEIEPLEAVDHHKYLGVEISRDLNR